MSYEEAGGVRDHRLARLGGPRCQLCQRLSSSKSTDLDDHPTSAHQHHRGRWAHESPRRQLPYDLGYIYTSERAFAGVHDG